MSRGRRLVRWLLIWAGLIVVLGFVLGAVAGPLAPPHLAWGGAFALGSSLALLLLPAPLDEE